MVTTAICSENTLYLKKIDFVMRFYLPLLILTFFTCTYTDKEERRPQTYDGKTYPSEHLYFQRTYPEKHLSLRAIQKEVEALQSKEYYQW